MALSQHNEEIEKINFGEYFDEEKWKKHFGEHFISQKMDINNKEALHKKFSFLRNIESFGELRFNNEEKVPLYIMKVENTKIASRVKLTSLAYNVIKEDINTGAALFFILYDGDENNYRFSYVKSTRGIKDRDIVDIKSDPKRYTFLLGKNTKTYTAETRLKKEIFTSIESIEEAFSVEAVNKEFYKGIKEHFEKLSENISASFDGDRKEANEFSLRFIGRLLFCWFLKEKNLVPTEVLKIDYTDKKNKNYYKDVLSILFFNVLNETIDNRKLTDSALAKYEKDIPFLNGGLFSKKDEDKKAEQIDNNIIEDIFGFFEKYNFTVDESTPIDIEISIDPEMLGRIFENLLAEINPETEKAARKETGSFYTPREIVDYMVVESIKLFLTRKLPHLKEKIENLFLMDDEETEYSEQDTKEILTAIHNMKILDPACGSGAFPMGILQRVFILINKLDPGHKYYKELILEKLDGAAKADIERRIANDTLDYIYKLDILQSMIHGVDIQVMATELSRLRAFLSLIVEENKDESDKDNLGIKPLPNLEFQFISANSLITLDLYESKDNKLGLDDDFTTSLINTMKKISKDYFNADTVEKKKEAKYNFEAFRQRLKYSTDERLIENNFKEKLLSWDPFKTKTADFFNHNIQFGMEGNFDIVLGNPPYLESRNKIFLDEYKEIYINSVKKDFFQYEHLLNRGMDLSIYFYLKALKLINNDGHICFVCTNSWLSTKYGTDFQQFLLNKNLNVVLVDTNFKQFSTAAINTIITFISFHKNSSVLFKYYVNDFSDKNILYNKLIENKLILSSYKWSILFTDKLNIFLEIIEKLNKGKTLNQVNLRYGQGLNGVGINKKGTEYFYHKEKPSFIFKKTDNKININDISDKRCVPIFIMPRGVAASYYCCYNELKAYSDSYVEILPNKNLTSSTDIKNNNILLNIWLFYNSTLGWFLREISGRNNLGGGLLKCEAIDLVNIPCVFDIPNDKIINLYKKCKDLNILGYKEEIQTSHHKEIDKILFDFLNLNLNEIQYINNEFIRLIEQRLNKSNKYSL